MEDIKKSFYGVPVLNGVNFTLNRGECVGLVGENGAGKSTLIKILCGVYTKDSGRILYDGKTIKIKNVEGAQAFGIRTIYQELSLFPTLTVEENIFIHNEINVFNTKSIIAPLNLKKMREEAIHVLHDKLRVNIDVKKRVEDIPFSQRQIVEIARAVYSNAQIIIMDEPTTALETKEKNQLFQVIEELKLHGKTIVFISHHLDEVLRVCDRIVALKDGNVVMEEETEKLNIDSLIKAMLGKSLNNKYPKTYMELGEVLLSVQGLTSEKYFHDISFDVREKEIVGIIGLAGCGKNEIIRALFGIIKHDKGTISLEGKQIQVSDVYSAMKHRFAFLPGDRKTEGIFPIQSVNWNVSIAAIGKICRWFGLDTMKETTISKKCINDLDIQVHSPFQLISRLSGGNQQKVILSRWFLTDPKVLFLEEPTRGIDVNAKAEVYKLTMEFVKKGNSVVMVSSEEEEVLRVCDKIIVIYEGRIVKILDAKDTTIEEMKYFSVNATEEGMQE